MLKGKKTNKHGHTRQYKSIIGYPVEQNIKADSKKENNHFLKYIFDGYYPVN